MHGNGLFQRNLDVLLEHFPDLHAELTAIATPLSSVIWDGGHAVDIDLKGGNSLYRGDGRRMTVAQVEEYLKKPVQVGYNVPTANNYDSLVSRAIHQGIIDSLARRKVEELPLKPVGRTGFAFVLGVGLGHHLPRLLESLTAAHVVLCEPFAEFLLAAMQAQDWAALMKRAGELGKTIDIVRGDTVEELFAEVGKVVSKHGNFKLDGSYFYEHYPLWLLQELRRRLVNELPRQMMSMGYFEDERKMVRNAAVNLHTGNYRLLDGLKFRPRGDVPVLLIGAGPSIDECIDIVRELRERAIVFSSGTALQVCLKNGIIPDFHTEIENTYDIYGKLKYILEENKHLFPEGRYKGVRLVGSTTLNPQVAPLFEDVYLYVREAVSSTHSFGRAFAPMTGVAPCVANTSTAVAARLGFGNIYFFGFDCGWRDEDSHHTKDSIYYTAEGFNWNKEYGEFTYPGNFGGTIQSKLVFDWSRNMLEQAISAFHLNVFNCSDGAFIHGATPKVAEAVDLPDALDREGFLAALDADTPWFGPGEFFKGHDFDEYLAELDWYVETTGAVLDKAMAERRDYGEFSREFTATLREIRQDARYRICGLVNYSVIGSVQQSSLFFHRIKDDDKRVAVAQDFYKLLGELIGQMAGEARQIIIDIKDWVVGGPEPAWKLGLPTTPGHTY